MPKFNYVAMDTKGKEVSGILETDNHTVAISRIREMGYFPTSVTEVGTKAKKSSKPSAPASAGGPKVAKRRARRVSAKST